MSLFDISNNNYETLQGAINNTVKGNNKPNYGVFGNEADRQIKLGASNPGFNWQNFDKKLLGNMGRLSATTNFHIPDYKIYPPNYTPIKPYYVENQFNTPGYKSHILPQKQKILYEYLTEQ